MLKLKQSKNSQMTSKKILITVLSAFIFVLIPSASVFAKCSAASSTDSDTGKLCYVQLEPNAFPGVSASSNLTTFLSQVFNFGIAAAVALALIMIIWGGIMKMTTDSWEKTDEANGKITNALYGLGIALISWILLYTINPALVDFSKNTLLNSKPSSPPIKFNSIFQINNDPTIDAEGDSQTMYIPRVE